MEIPTAYYAGAFVFGALGHMIAQFGLWTKGASTIKIRKIRRREQIDRFVRFLPGLAFSMLVTLLARLWMLDDFVAGDFGYSKPFAIQAAVGIAPFPILKGIQRSAQMLIGGGGKSPDQNAEN